MPETTIRVATVSDIPAVLALWRDAGAEPTHTDDDASLNRLIARDDAALLVAVHDGRLVGSVIAGWDGWRGSVYRLAVAPDHRRRRLANRLLGEAEKRLREAGAVRLQAIVVDTDEQAVRFWQASEWEQQTGRARFVKS
jgi:ribosomal protein S18 acetylase RimI-like enzyme